MTMIRSELAKQVSAALEQDERTGDLNIEVIEENGIITLKGQVPSAEVRSAAETIASAAEDVVDVINALVVEAEDEDKIIVPPPVATVNKNHPPY